MADPNIIPFGKYKGRLVEELLINDPQYLQWLTNQDWFRTEHVLLYQVVINRGAEPEHTPEHNAMQVKFLDDDFCRKFLRRLPTYDETKHGSAKIERYFEFRGIDVILVTTVTKITSPLSDEPFERGVAAGIEIKPVVGDDYPAVLRRMMAAKFDRWPGVTGGWWGYNMHQVLFLSRYEGRGATKDQFIKTLKTADIEVVFEAEVIGAEPVELSDPAHARVLP
jgi:hypothetical protein